MNQPAGSPPSGEIAINPSQALADRVGANLYDLEVVEVSRISASVQRVVLAGGALGEMSYQAGQDMMLAFSPDGQTRLRRRYTIRSLDRARGTVALDILLHGDGPGSRWAAAARPGQRIEGIGPRGKVFLDTAASWHLFIGDEAFAPASFAMSEAHSATSRSTILLEVDSAEDELDFDLPGSDDQLLWVHRQATSEPSSLLGALATLDAEPSDAHVYVGGEFHLVTALRQALAGAGFAPEQISFKPYWRSGAANAEHGEPHRD